MIKLILLPFIFAAVCTMSACGQKGDLYLPTEQAVKTPIKSKTK